MMSEPVVTTVTVACSQRHAFDVFTSKVNMWWPNNHRKFNDSTLLFEKQMGGRFLEVSSTGEEVERGIVFHWDPPRCFKYTWYPAMVNVPTEVEVSFLPQENQTKVTVVHSESKDETAPNWPQRAKLFKTSWAEVLPIFQTYCSQEKNP